MARKVALGSQLRLRFKQEVRLLKKATAKIAKQDQRIQAREEEIKKLNQEIKSLQAMDTKVQGLCNQTRNLETLIEAEAQVTGEERIKATFEEFKKYKDDQVNFWCTEIDARLDAMSIDFDEELYPRMLTVIAGRRWMIGHGLRLAVMKCDESMELSPSCSEGFKVPYSRSAGEVEGCTLIDVLKITVYPEVCDPKEEILLADAIAANISRTKKKKKCRVVCHIHGVSSTYHSRSKGVLVSVPTVAPRGLVILLADAAM
ncbi:hypothetical protein Tco_1413748 [Tanacetum coccineum]